jgi:hypothetical protein
MRLASGVVTWRCKKHSPDRFAEMERERVKRHEERTREAEEKREALLREFARKTRQAEAYPVLAEAVRNAAAHLAATYSAGAQQVGENLARALARCERMTRVE